VPDPRGIPSLSAYLDSLDSASHGDFAARSDSRVAHEDAFSAMKDHVVELYRDVSATHSFVDETGSVFDCIPVDQQPALRGTGEGPASAPDLPETVPGGADDPDERQDALAGALLGGDRTDWHGNAMECPEGTVPMRRVVLDDLTRFATLDDFLRKGEGGVGRPPRASEPATVPVTHRWAHAYQNVVNGGGHSYLNIWSPAIGANQVFSLSQHWYVGGSGANLQTVECGWQVYPALYGDSRPHLFTYWTADDYGSTGCYNLSCSAFVQTSSSFAPGMAVGPVSVSGGSQYTIELAYWLTGGRWWLYFNGTQGANAIGYYPVSLFGGGALATAASEIDYGGETTGTTSFPPMGSGAFANQGWQRAAYQRTVGYWPPQGGNMVNANLTASQGWPGCYTAEVVMYAAPWFETVWFGGPGGSC
jgi:Neprosin/Neprosin activation peptide